MLGTGAALAIGAGTSLLGGLINSNQAKQQAKGVQAAADAANRTQQAQYDQTRTDQAAWRDAGGAAATRLSKLMGLAEGGSNALNQSFDYNQNTDPGTQFRIAQANKALERSAAAKGNLLSGGTLKALAGYNQEMASQEYGNAYNRWKSNQDTTYNRLAGIAGLGQTATQATGQAGMNYANQFGQNAIGGAQSQASAGIAGANAITNGINQGLNAYNQSQMMDQGLNAYNQSQMLGFRNGMYNKNPWGGNLYGSGYGGIQEVE